MFSVQEFDCLLLGDEPGGLWLLDKLSSRRRVDGAAETPLQLAWISLEQASGPIALPTRIASDFGIPVSDPWHCEIVTPSEKFLWELGSLEKRFPQLDPNRLMASGEIFGQSQIKRAGAALRIYPELLGIASAVLRLFAHAESFQPETALLSALYCLEFTWWDPQANLDSNILRINPDNPIEKIYFSQTGKIAIQLANRSTLLSQNLILGGTFRSLLPLLRESEDLRKMVNLEENCLSAQGLFPLRIKADPKVVSRVVRPVSIALDTLEVPDLDSEVFPFQCRFGEEEAEIVLWASDRSAVHLDSVLERFRQGLKRLYHYFPFLPKGIISLEFPLDAESCTSEEARGELIDRLSKHAMEKYQMARTDSRTRNHKIFLIAPNSQCYFPHPYGSLSAAKSILKTLVGRDKLQKKTSSTLPEGKLPPLSRERS